MSNPHLLIEFLHEPARTVNKATHSDWTDFLQTARRYGLLATFYTYFDKVGLLNELPEKVLRHLLSGQNYANKQAHSIINELILLEKIFADAEYNCVLLKGVAYRCAGFDYSKGRLFSDIDLLVPIDCLDDANMRLSAFGYVESELSTYDRNYYLHWSHQVPPKHNLLTGASLDLHHHIYPVISSLKLNIEPFMVHTCSLDGSKFVIPQHSLMFVHACVHLFYQDESHKLTKDVIDLWMLFQEARSCENEILVMANKVGAEHAVAYGLELLTIVFYADLDNDTYAWLNRYRPKNSLVIWLIKSMLFRKGGIKLVAHTVWFLRGHLLKMGPLTLAYHMIARSYNKFKEYREIAKKRKELDMKDLPEDAN